MAADGCPVQDEPVTEGSTLLAHHRRVAALTTEISRLAGPSPDTAGIARICKMVDEQFEALQFDYKDPDDILDEAENFAPFEGFDPALVALFRRMRYRLPEQVRRGENFPVEAGAAREVFHALGRDRDYEVRELAGIAVKDPVLAGSLIRVANSSLYSPAARFTRAAMAISYIGTAQARKVMLAAALRPLFASAGLTRLWAHSVNAARLCAALAEKTECVAPEDGLILGLVHDLGAMAFEFAPPETRERHARLLEGGCPVTYVERLLFGCDHGEIGAEILAQWKFSGELVEAVRFHHQPERSESPLTAFIYLVEFWSGLDEDLPSFRRVEQCLSRTGLNLEVLAQTGTKDNALKTLRGLD